MQCAERTISQNIDPVECANSILTQLGIIEPPTFSINVANSIGMGVEFVTMDRLAEHVVSFIDPKRKTISINEHAPGLLYNFSVARDIGMWTMYPDYVRSPQYRIIPHTKFYESLGRYDDDATKFALALLAPDTMIKSFGPAPAIRKAIIEDPSLITKMADWFQIPPKAMALATINPLT